MNKRKKCKKWRKKRENELISFADVIICYLENAAESVVTICRRFHRDCWMYKLMVFLYAKSGGDL